MLSVLILSSVAFVGCGGDSSEEWPFEPVVCASAFRFDEACVPCAQEHCAREMDATFGSSWMMDNTFDGTGRCVGLLSCRCECKLEDRRVEGCSGCLDYAGESCADAIDAVQSCMTSKCGGHDCRPA